MGMSRQAVQRLADELVAGGYACWRENPAHRRSMLLEPTEIGFDALDAVIARQVQWANAVGRLIDIDDAQRATETLEKIIAACAEVARETE